MGSEVGFGGTASEDADGGIVAQTAVVEAFSCAGLVWGSGTRR